MEIGENSMTTYKGYSINTDNGFIYRIIKEQCEKLVDRQIRLCRRDRWRNAAKKNRR